MDKILSFNLVKVRYLTIFIAYLCITFMILYLQP